MSVCGFVLMCVCLWHQKMLATENEVRIIPFFSIFFFKFSKGLVSVAFLKKAKFSDYLFIPFTCYHCTLPFTCYIDSINIGSLCF